MDTVGAGEGAGGVLPQSLLEREAALRRMNAEIDAQTAKRRQRREAAQPHDHDHSVDLEDEEAVKYSGAHHDALDLADGDAGMGRGGSTSSARTRGDGGNSGGVPMAGDGAADEDGPEAGLGPEAQVRYQRARLRVATDERNAALAARRDVEGRLKEALEKLEASAAERKRLAQTVASAEASADKARKQAARSNSRVSALETQVQSLEREVEAAGREVRSRESETNSRDVRLQRALEDNARLKEALRAAAASSKEGVDAVRRQVDGLQAEVRRLERQKMELLGAFRKQLRLIDILKRQKVHMEAARMLAFTEDEFARTLEMGV